MTEEIKFTEREVYALLASYYMACSIVGEIMGAKEAPCIAPDIYQPILIKMQPKLLSLSEKVENGHLENIA